MASSFLTWTKNFVLEEEFGGRLVQDVVIQLLEDYDGDIKSAETDERCDMDVAGALYYLIGRYPGYISLSDPSGVSNPQFLPCTSSDVTEAVREAHIVSLDEIECRSLRSIENVRLSSMFDL